ncbi:mechanosensitive ion channel family protein [Marispirochaeta sp.]|uniref:mechanosensitive ion channel family protein n=1 Tax=Marispirochaeta sp. TaxID=2038653 RepID=UPI0029C68D25|nr:mechanosensitive ion channel family protein [Marispirochaeta sp.]
MLDQLNEYSFLGNSLFVYLRAIIILLCGLIVVSLLHAIIGHRLKRRSKSGEEGNRWWIASTAFNRIIVPLLYIAVIRLSIAGLVVNEMLNKVMQGIVSAIIAVLAVRAAIFLLETSLRKYAQKTGHEEDEKRIKPLLSFISFILWVTAFIFLLDNLGFNISTLVAGLGVSGIAVAIAAQGILGDLFNYFVIFFDRPFELGDFIIFDDKMGIIEKIGIKTTRVRTLSGEQLVVSNSNLVNARLHNYKRMERRRIVFRIGVTYQTPASQLVEIPGIIKGIIEEVDGTQFDRSHFQGYGDFALTFETVYYVLSPDYLIYMDVQQRINLDLFRAFEERGIEFAYPTQTLYLRSQGMEVFEQQNGLEKEP